VGSCAFMLASSGLGAGYDRGEKNLLAGQAREGGAFTGEASLLAATTFVAKMLVVGFLFSLFLFFLAARTVQAALSNSLVPPTITVPDCVGPLGGCRGAPWAGRPGGAETVKGRGPDARAGVGAAT